MRQLYIFLCASICLAACKKDSSIPGEHQQLNTVKKEAYAFLKKEMTTNAFNQLDWSSATNGKIGTDGFVVIIKDKEDESGYLMVINRKGKWSSNYVNLKEDLASKSGTITIQNLGKTTTREVIYKNGKSIESPGNKISENSLHPKTNNVSEGGGDLPPVVVYATRFDDNMVITLQSLMWLNQDPDFRNIYLAFGGGGYGSNGVISGGYYVEDEIAYEIDFDDSEAREKVAFSKMMNCFWALPATDATYSATICADIPVNGLPNAIVGPDGPGHAFIILTKTVGSQSITQCFGFYPESGLKSATTLPVTSAIKNDTQHTYDASLTMPNISEANFVALIGAAAYNATKNYDLNDYNCTNFALETFNSIRPSTDKIVVQGDSRLMGGIGPTGLYSSLQSLKNSNYPEAANVSIAKKTSPTSHGECN